MGLFFAFMPIVTAVAVSSSTGASATPIFAASAHPHIPHTSLCGPCRQMSHSYRVPSTVVVFRSSRRRHMPHCHSVELGFIKLSSTESENFSLCLIPVFTRVPTLSVSTVVSNSTIHTISNTAVFRQKLVGRLSSQRRGMEPLFALFSRIPSKMYATLYR